MRAGMLVDPDNIESWVSHLLTTCASVEPVSESDHCQIGMTAIVMGDVSAVDTLERAHRRQLLAARALERTFPAHQRTPLLAHKDDWRRVH